MWRLGWGGLVFGGANAIRFVQVRVKELEV